MQQQAQLAQPKSPASGHICWTAALQRLHTLSIEVLMHLQLVMEQRRFATLVASDLVSEYNCVTDSPEHDLLVECSGLQVGMFLLLGCRLLQQ